MTTRIFALGFAAVLATAANAQQMDNAQHGSHNPAVKDSKPHSVGSPAEGANSFTENQAKERLAKAGYTVTTLAKDDNGVWRGTATKGGKSVNVGLDYKGNVTTR